MNSFDKKNKVSKIHTKVLVVGGGAAGMSALLNLKIKDVILVEAPGSNSVMAAWNIMIKPKEDLRMEMSKAGGSMGDKELLNKFLEMNEDVVNDLKKHFKIV